MDLLDLHLGRPVHRGALTLFPIWNGHAVSARGYDLADDRLGVEERAGAAVVAELVVTNPGHRPALLLEGELLPAWIVSSVQLQHLRLTRESWQAHPVKVTGLDACLAWFGLE